MTSQAQKPFESISFQLFSLNNLDLMSLDAPVLVGLGLRAGYLPDVFLMISENRIRCQSLNSGSLYESHSNTSESQDNTNKTQSENDSQNILSTFTERITHRALNEAMLTPSLLKAAIKFCDLAETYDRLNWGIPNQKGFRMMGFNESFAFKNEDGSTFQCQLDIPRIDKGKNKSIRYESVKGQGSSVFWAPVPTDIRQEMSALYGVEVPLEGSFWDWFKSSEEARKLPLIITEGGFKALAALSLGIPAISLYGCSAGFEKRESVYDARKLCLQLDSLVYKHKVIICFDQDTKPQTCRRVAKALSVLASALKSKCTVQVAPWKPEQGKGIDDFIQAQGGEAFLKVLSQAFDYAAWKKLNTQQRAKSVLNEAAKLTADIIRDARWVNDCGFPLPKLGEALLTDSAMGTGKTLALRAVIKALRVQYPDLIVELKGHRNNLLRQTASPERLNLSHIRDLEAGSLTQMSVESATAIAYCIDSLIRRYDRLIRACENGQKILIILDELDAVLTHLLTASTLSSQRRMKLIAQFSTLLQLIGQGHGWVIGGEANLSGLAVRALQKLSKGKLKIVVCRNTHKPAQWQVFDHSHSNAAANKLAAIAFTEECLNKGEKILLLTSSQEASEQFEAMLGSKHKTIRLDSKNSTEKEIQGLLKNVNVTLPILAPSLLIGTPTIESGVSIDIAYFDRVILYGGGLEPRALFQMLGRVRHPVPRHLFVAATSQVRMGLDADDILSKWERNISKAIADHQLETPQQIEAIEIGKQIAAEITARSEAGAMRLRETLIELLKKDGHTVSKKPYVAPEGTKERLAQAKEIVIEGNCKLWLELDDSKLTVKEARHMMRQELPYKDSVLAQKAIMRDKYEGLVDDEAWVTNYWASGGDSRRVKRSVESAAIFANPEMAREIDQQTLSHQIDTTGTAWSPTFDGKEAVVQLLKNLQFDQILSIPEGGKLHGETWQVTFVFRQAQKHAVEVKEILGISITEKTKPMAFVNDVLQSRLGAKIECSKTRLPDSKKDNEALNARIDHLCVFSASLSDQSPNPPIKREVKPARKRREKGTGAGKLTRCYSIVSMPYRAEMLEAIQSHHNKQELEEGFEGGEIPGQRVEFRGEDWIVLSASKHKLRVIPVGVDPTIANSIEFDRSESAGFSWTSLKNLAQMRSDWQEATSEQVRQAILLGWADCPQEVLRQVIGTSTIAA